MQMSLKSRVSGSSTFEIYHRNDIMDFVFVIVMLSAYKDMINFVEFMSVVFLVG